MSDSNLASFPQLPGDGALRRVDSSETTTSGPRLEVIDALASTCLRGPKEASPPPISQHVVTLRQPEGSDTQIDAVRLACLTQASLTMEAPKQQQDPDKALLNIMPDLWDGAGVPRTSRPNWQSLGTAEAAEMARKWIREHAGEVTSLKLSMIPHIPPEIGQLTALRTLTIKNSHKLTSFPPEIMEKLTVLETLSIENSGLTSLPSTIGNLSALKELNVSKSQLQSFPEELHNCRSLEKLIAKDNKLSSLSNNIGQLKNLKELQLAGNNLVNLPDSLCDLTKLEVLDLGSNKLQTLPQNMQRLKELRELMLGYNKLTDLPQGLLNQLPKLSTLSLISNLLKEVPQDLHACKALRTLFFFPNPGVPYISSKDADLFQRLDVPP